MKSNFLAVPVHYAGRIIFHIFIGLSYPYMFNLPARSSRQSLRRPCWIQGTSMRLSRTQTTMPGLTPLTYYPFVPIRFRLFTYPGLTRGGARASHVAHISLITCHALRLRRLPIPCAPVFIPTPTKASSAEVTVYIGMDVKGFQYVDTVAHRI